MIDLIAFDADDTLWHNEDLYRDARDRFRELLQPYIGSPPGRRPMGEAAGGDAGDPSDPLDDLVHETEIRNLPFFGFGVTSFVLSLIETAIEVTGGRITGAEIGRLLAVAKEMISAEVRIIDEVEDTLAALSADYPLLLITKGDLLHQEDKVARSGLGQYFSGVEVVSDKTPEVYRAILKRRDVEPARFVMIGNSLRSDILPVAALGGQAIYVPTEMTWIYDVVDLPDELPGNVYRVGRVGEVVGLIRSLALGS
jgi:putative hydrolase of the HAD superfamily